MSDPLACVACRPAYQRLRAMDAYAEATPADRRLLLGAWLEVVHRHDHDEHAAATELLEQAQAEEERRRIIGRAAAIRCLLYERGLLP